MKKSIRTKILTGLLIIPGGSYADRKRDNY